MTYNVCVVTGSRAEYGLLRALLFKLRDDNQVLLQLVVTGSHLSDAFGNTQTEIENDGFEINSRIAIPLAGDSKAEMAKVTGTALSAFADYFEKSRPDLLVVLGDRYEIFAVSAAAAIMGIAIAHISGGDVTQGAVDEIFRHCITKMSHLHFPGCKQSAERIIQLGEDPARVFNVGELGMENCLSVSPMSLSDLQKQIDFDIIRKPYAIVTFHSVTAENKPAELQVDELILALEYFSDMNFIITKSNADAGSRAINEIWDKQAKIHSNWLVISSLGVKCYISAMKYAEMMIGNSSSGIIEAPVMRIPTVNIGNRQKGRITADSIISCSPEKNHIIAAIEKARTPEFKEIVKNVISPFGIGNTSEQIHKRIMNWLFSHTEFNPMKRFYDIHWEEQNEEHCNYPC